MGAHTLRDTATQNLRAFGPSPAHLNSRRVLPKSATRDKYASTAVSEVQVAKCRGSSRLSCHVRGMARSVEQRGETGADSDAPWRVGTACFRLWLTHLQPIGMAAVLE